MQTFTTRRGAILCLALALSAYCYAQNLTIGNALPCGNDNLSCFSDGVCYLRSELCNGVGVCPLFGEDEGGAIINALDCVGAFGPEMRYRCNAGTQVLTLDLLCDGNADCAGGDDETNALCANKCRLPFYGGCSYTRQCASSVLSVNCGACLSGLVDVGQMDCLPLCPLQSDPDNGAVMCTGTGTSVDDTCTYTCDNGFELVGPMNTTCTEAMDGNSATFSPAAPPVCRPLCPVQNDPANGMVMCTGTGALVNDTCTYTCDVGLNGFELIGSNTTTCTEAADRNSATFLPAPLPVCRPLCPVQSDPANAMVMCTGTGTSVDDTCTYTCDVGFELIGSNTTTCTLAPGGSSARFSPAPPVCEPLCSDPPALANATVTFTGNSVGDTATYTCDSGFELIGDPTTTCTTAADGSSATFLAVPSPECSPRCPDPPTLANGMRTFTGNSVNDTATYTCDSGFELIGDPTTTCSAAVDGNSATFSAVRPPECSPLCLDPPSIINGMRTSTGISVNDTATYTCNPGFELIGNSTTTCTAAADWNSATFPAVPPLECRPLCPDPPAITNGMRTFTGNLVNDTATYTCNPGFELIEDSTTTCTAAADGNSAIFLAVPPPECRPLCSDPVNPVNGMVTFTGNSVADTATYSCNMGFELVGSATVTCTSHVDGNLALFIPVSPVCRPLCPGPIDPVNGMVTFTGNSVDDTATYSCNMGFELIGSATATCTQVDVNSAAFSTVPPVCRPLCSDPVDPVNGMVTFTGNSVDDTATYSCNMGFELVGSTTGTCTQVDVNSAIFLPVPPVCRPPCLDPVNPVNGMVTFTGNSADDNATYSCSMGFELVGSATAMCTQVDMNSAAFSPVPPVCRPLCSDPVDTVDGVVTFTGNSVADNATYSCNMGFELVGSATATCTQVDVNSAVFSPVPPVCRPLCFHQVDPVNGMATFTGNSIDDTADYSCNMGFELVGSATATCTQADINSAAFSPAPPVCRPLCPDPVDPINGMVTFTGNTIDDTATYSCNMGFELVSSAITATCTQMDVNSAAFSPVPPVCRPLCSDPPVSVNGMRTFSGNSVGDTATYSCNTGFELIGDSTTMCTQIDANSAEFPAVPPPECRPLCSDPPALVNGMRIFTGNSVGDTATYTCNSGFELIGNLTTTCTMAVDGSSATFPPLPPSECRPEDNLSRAEIAGIITGSIFGCLLILIIIICVVIFCCFPSCRSRHIPKKGGTTLTYGNVGGDLVARNEAALDGTEKTNLDSGDCYTKESAPEEITAN